MIGKSELHCWGSIKRKTQRRNITQCKWERKLSLIYDSLNIFIYLFIFGIKHLLHTTDEVVYNSKIK